jgi:hypothetical protein
LQNQKPKWRHRLEPREGTTSHGSCTRFLMVGWPSVLLLAVPRLCCPRRNCRVENDMFGLCLPPESVACHSDLRLHTLTHSHSHTRARRVVTRSSRSADANGRRACHNSSTHHRHRAQDGRQVMRISPSRARSLCCVTTSQKHFWSVVLSHRPRRFRGHTPCSLWMASMLAPCTLTHSLTHPRDDCPLGLCQPPHGRAAADILLWRTR